MLYRRTVKKNAKSVTMTIPEFVMLNMMVQENSEALEGY